MLTKMLKKGQVHLNYVQKIKCYLSQNTGKQQIKAPKRTNFELKLYFFPSKFVKLLYASVCHYFRASIRKVKMSDNISVRILLDDIGI